MHAEVLCRLDDFHFDGMTSMLYWHHDINMSASEQSQDVVQPCHMDIA